MAEADRVNDTPNLLMIVESVQFRKMMSGVRKTLSAILPVQKDQAVDAYMDAPSIARPKKQIPKLFQHSNIAGK